MRKRDNQGRQKPSEKACDTKSIDVHFRVTYKQFKRLVRKAGGRGKLSGYIRGKLGLENKLAK